MWFRVSGLCFPGVDLITACDIRYCAQDAFFQVKVSHPPSFCFLGSCLELSSEWQSRGRAGTAQANMMGVGKAGLE